jgi:hypothetical protein
VKKLLFFEFLKLIIVFLASFFAVNYTINGSYYFLYSLCLLGPSLLITPFVKRTISIGVAYENSIAKISLFSILINFLIVTSFYFIYNLTLDIQTTVLFIFLIFFPTFIPLRSYWRIVSINRNFWLNLRLIILIIELTLLLIWIPIFGVGVYILITGLGALSESIIHLLFGKQFKNKSKEHKLVSNNPIEMLRIIYAAGKLHDVFIRYIFQRQLEAIGPIFFVMQSISGSVAAGVERYFYKPNGNNIFSYLVIYGFFAIGLFLNLTIYFIDLPLIKREDIYYQYMWIPFFYVLPFLSTLRAIRVIGTNKVSLLSGFGLTVSLVGIISYSFIFELALNSIIMVLIHPVLSLFLYELFIYIENNKNEVSNNKL